MYLSTVQCPISVLTVHTQSQKEIMQALPFHPIPFFWIIVSKVRLVSRSVEKTLAFKARFAKGSQPEESREGPDTAAARLQQTHPCFLSLSWITCTLFYGDFRMDRMSSGVKLYIAGCLCMWWDRKDERKTEVRTSLPCSLWGGRARLGAAIEATNCSEKRWKLFRLGFTLFDDLALRVYCAASVRPSAT